MRLSPELRNNVADYLKGYHSTTEGVPDDRVRRLIDKLCDNLREGREPLWKFWETDEEDIRHYLDELNLSGKFPDDPNQVLQCQLEDVCCEIGMSGYEFS